MPAAYREMLQRVSKSAGGRKALKKYKKFWGIPYPTNVSQFKIPGNLPGAGGRKGKAVLVGMGRSPMIVLANGPKGKATQIRRFRRKGVAAFNINGNRIYLLSGKQSRRKGSKLKFIGWAAETHYVPTGPMEKAGTFKKGRYWVHEHHESGGKWPKAYVDSAGNVIYGPGTYRITDWIRR